MSSPAPNILRLPPSYASQHSRSELHAMLDNLIDTGGQWLVELHFNAWMSRRKKESAAADRPAAKSRR